MSSKSAKYYRSHPEARKVKARTDAKINRRPEQKAKRAELNKINRESQSTGRTRKGDGKDASHTRGGIVFKSQSINRGSKKDQAGDRRARGSR